MLGASVLPLLLARRNQFHYAQVLPKAKLSHRSIAYSSSKSSILKRPFLHVAMKRGLYHHLVVIDCATLKFPFQEICAPLRRLLLYQKNFDFFGYRV